MKREYVKPTEAPASTTEQRRRKTGLLIGHSLKDQGANNKDWFPSSAEWSVEYGTYIKEYDIDGDKFLEEYELNLKAAKVSGLTYATRDEGRGRRGAAEELAEADCNEIISMHCNSYNSRAMGFEVWYLDGVIESKRFAERTVAAMALEFPDHINRGIKKGTKHSRAYGVLDAGRDHGVRKTILVEWYFIDVESDFITPEKIGAFLKRYGVH